EALGDGGDEAGGATAREYARGLPRLVRLAGRRRPVSRSENDRGFPAAPFARRQRAPSRSRRRGASAPEPASLVANSTARSRVVSSGRFRFGISVRICAMARKTVLVCDNCGTE